MNTDTPAMDDSHHDDPELRSLLDAVDARLGDGGPAAGGGTALFDDLRVRCQGAFAGDAPSGAAGQEASEALRARRVAGRVLRATTREDLGRVGDLRVVLRFVGERLRDSRALRILAAVLLAQVTIVPVIAYHLLEKARPTTFDLEFSPRYDELVDDMPRLDPDRDYPVEDPEIEIEVDGLPK